MRIAYVLYPGFTALDLVGPYEVISRWRGAEVHFVRSGSLEPVHADVGLIVMPTHTVDTVPAPDVVVVPGAGETASLDACEDEALIGWLRAVAPDAQWLASACTGSFLYAAAGLLDGKRATTHWAMRDNLKAMGVDVVAERVVFDGKMCTGAGVSAGIDMALALTGRVHGEKVAKAIQLGIEYDPQPPFDSGSPAVAQPSTLRLAMRLLLGDTPLSNARRVATHQVTSRLRRVRTG